MNAYIVTSIQNVVWGYYTGWAGENLLAKVCLWFDLEMGEPNHGWV